MGQGSSSGLTTGWPLQLLPSPGLRVFIPPMGTFVPLCPLHRCPVKYQYLITRVVFHTFPGSPVPFFLPSGLCIKHWTARCLLGR